MKKHFMLIDDDRDELEIFHTALGLVSTPCKCTYAASSEHALKMLEFLVPDFIFIDINMPKANGWEFVEEVRKRPALHDIPLYMYSNGVNEQVINEAMLKGVTGCIQKTAGIAELAKRLDEVIQHLDPVSH